MKKETITLAIKYLRSAGFPGQHQHIFDEEKNAAWLELFSDIPDAKFITAIKDIVKTSKYFPTVSEIRERVFKSTTMLSGDAWAEVLEQIKKLAGTGRKPHFSSHIIERVVRSLGGLNNIWMSGVEKEGIYRAQFIKAYDAISEKEQESLMLGEPTKDEAQKILDDFGIKPKEIADIPGKDDLPGVGEE